MKQSSKYLLALVPLLLIGGILYYFSDIVAYVVIAWIVSMVGAPFVRFFNKKLKPGLSATITLAIFALLFVLLISLFVPTIVQQARNLAGIDYNALATSLEEPINDWNTWLVDKGLIESADEAIDSPAKEELRVDDRIQAELIEVDRLLKEGGDTTTTTQVTVLINVQPESSHSHDTEEVASQDFFETIQSGVLKYLNPAQIPALFGSVFGFFSNFLIAIMSIFFISFFFLKENGLFDSMITSFVPDEYVGKTLDAVNNSSKMLVRYFIGVIFQITLITLFVSMLLSILGVKNALLIGFFAALMNVIPYLGPLFGAAFAILITISSNLELSFYTEMLPLIGKVIAVFGIMQLLDNFILQPNIFSRSVKAHPLEIFIIVLVGAKLGGILGMVLAIPAYTVLRVVAKEFLSGFKIVQSITKSI